MGEDRIVQLTSQSRIEDPLTELLCEKAGELLHAAVNDECEAFLERLVDRRDDHGRQPVVRNGYLPRRKVLTGVGAVQVPRVRDRAGSGMRFESKLVPAYVRRTKSVDAVLPWLYLARHRPSRRGTRVGGAGGYGTLRGLPEVHSFVFEAQRRVGYCAPRRVHAHAYRPDGRSNLSEKGRSYAGASV